MYTFGTLNIQTLIFYNKESIMFLNIMVFNFKKFKKNLQRYHMDKTKNIGGHIILKQSVYKLETLFNVVEFYFTKII